MIDPIASFWLLLWATLSTFGLYLLLTEDKAASRFYVYGKSLDVKKKGLFWKWFLLPKKYFIHFYLSALILFIPSFAIVFIYYSPSKLGSRLNDILDVLINQANNYVKLQEANTLTSVTALIFTLILMIIQCSRRLYESLLVSVYSNSSKINIIHYAFGHIFYAAAAISTIVPILVSNTSNKFNLIGLFDNLVNAKRAILFTLFIYASHHQHKCHQILANLRKDRSGRVITEQHYVPSGGLFEYVSCPHFLIEVILYMLILFVQEFQSFYWNLIFLLVISTQTINAITEHKWYKRNYKDYPETKKAIFPGLL